MPLISQLIKKNNPIVNGTLFDRVIGTYKATKAK